MGYYNFLEGFNLSLFHWLGSLNANPKSLPNGAFAFYLMTSSNGYVAIKWFDGP